MARRDAGFGTSGRVSTNVAGSSDESRAVAIQRDGKIVVARPALVAEHYDFALARYR
jgi:hypothetical protein